MLSNDIMHISENFEIVAKQLKVTLRSFLLQRAKNSHIISFSRGSYRNDVILITGVRPFPNRWEPTMVSSYTVEPLMTDTPRDRPMCPS